MSDSEIRIETSPAAAKAPRPAEEGERPEELAIVPLRETVLFPQAVIPLAVARPSSVRAVDDAVRGGRLLGLVTQHTRLYESERDIQRGVLLGFSCETWNVTGYLFDPDEEKPTFVLALGVSF